MPLASLLPLGIIAAALGVGGTLLGLVPFLTRGEVRASPTRLHFFLASPKKILRFLRTGLRPAS